MQPRDFQLDCIRATEDGWNDFSKQLIVIPTGGGKTIIFSHLAERFLNVDNLWSPNRNRTLILAHREELIDQAIAKLHKATGICASKDKAEDYGHLTADVVVASVQTLMREKRLSRWPSDHFGLVVIDEAHHALAESYRNILRHFDSHANVLGVTATPDRGDKKNLGQYFENVPYEISLFELIHRGWLSPIVIKSLPIEIDIRSVGQRGGDFADEELGHAIEPYLARIAQELKQHTQGRRTLAFLPLIQTSVKFVEECKKVGINTRHVDGTSDDRKDILSEFSVIDFDLLSNAMLLTEGYDDPGIDCILNLRPTKSRPLYAQIIGRGTRIAPLKDNLLVLDFLWLHEKHKICRPASLIAKSEEEEEEITRLSIEPSGGQNQELDLEELAVSAGHAREASLARKIAENRKKKGKTISAEEFALQYHALDTAQFEATMPWHSQPITEKQERILKRAKIDISTVTGKGHACELIDLHFRNQKLVLASEKQRSKMKSMGFEGWETATAQQAGKFFAQLRK